MKRRALLKHLKEHGREFFRKGKEHSVYWDPANRRVTTVPRHVEVLGHLARKICKDLGIPRC